MRLDRAIREKAAEPFAWGRHDCCRSVCDCITAMTGREAGPMLRRYKTVRGAAGVLKRHGGVEGLAEAIAALGGFAEIIPAKAGAGDMAIVHHESDRPLAGDTLGIVALDGRHMLLAGEIGWTEMPVRTARRAWRVG